MSGTYVHKLACSVVVCVCVCARQWEAVDAEIKVPSGENTELKHSPFKAWSSQYITIHVTLTARDFFLDYF